MTNKLIFVSKLVFFNDSNELIEENLRIADYFNDEMVKLAIVAQQDTINILKKNIPKEYESKIKFVNRSSKTKEKIKELKDKGGIFGVIGIVEEDAIFSFNCKIPLFNPEALSSRVTVSEKVKTYGLPIIDFQNIVDCFKAYEIHKDNYFQMSFGDSFSVISLNNANTYYRPEEEARVKQIFETNLKGSKSERDKRILLLLLFHLINEVTTNPYYNKIDYWGTFPSSNPQNISTSVAFLKEAVRVVIGGGPRKGPEILIRNQQMQSKHSSGSSIRLENKSNNDFETLIVNPALRNSIKGKVICIIDDYITNGYSAEAAKHLLIAAGAKEIIFLSFGKFGKKYFSTNYAIDGDVYSQYTYNFIEEELYEGNIGNEKFYNPNNDSEILNFTNLI